MSAMRGLIGSAFPRGSFAARPGQTLPARAPVTDRVLLRACRRRDQKLFRSRASFVINNIDIGVESVAE